MKKFFQSSKSSVRCSAKPRPGCSCCIAPTTVQSSHAPLQLHLPPVYQGITSYWRIHWLLNRYTYTHLPLKHLYGFFLCEEKRGQPMTMHWLLQFEPSQHQVSTLPLVPATLEQLQESTIFTKLDLKSTCNLVCINEGDEWRIAISTTSGHFEYRIIPYGVSSAPAVFQCLVHNVLSGMLEKLVIVYTDNLLIWFP